jgi:ankyrin repeat protein
MAEEVRAWALTSLLSSQEAAAPIQEIQRLIAANPAVITEISGSGRTALIEAAVREHREAVALLLDHGAAVDAQDRNSWTALHWAGMQGNADIATLLLAAASYDGVTIRSILLDF